MNNFQGEDYMERKVVISVIGLLAVYGFSPVGKEWMIPRSIWTTAKLTSSPRVRMRRGA